jgi:hypothetical protein
MGTTIGGNINQPKLTDIKIDDVQGSDTAQKTTQPDKSNADPKTEARQSEGSKQNSNDYKRQTDVRGSYVQQQLEKAYQNAQPKVPDPNKYVPKNGVPSKEPQSPSTTSDRSKSAVGEAGRLSGKVEYDKLPDDLKSKMNQVVWKNMDENQRNTTVETYRRLKDYGLWDEVKSVDGGKEPATPNAKIGGKEFEVKGDTAAVNFTAKDGDSLQKKLIATRHFGKDGDIMGSQHSGQKSNREWTATDEKGLHVSIGKNNKFDVHIDKHSPVKEPVNGKTQVDLGRAKKHGVNELIPGKINKKLGGKGIIIDGSIEENRKGWHGAEVKVGVKYEIHGPVKKKTQLPKTGPESANPASEKMMEKITDRVSRAHIHFPTPIGMNPDEMPDPQAIATRMAAEMLDAARNGRTSIQMNVPEYLNQHGDQAKALKYMEEIGKIVRSELVAADPKLNSVVGLTVTFGAKTQRGSVPLR